MLEDFHSLGRLATAALIDLAQIGASDRVLDAGTGIGGTARLIAAERGARVTAVDLTSEYCEVARWLNDAVGLGDMIEVRAGRRHAAPIRRRIVRRRRQPARPDERRGQAPALCRGASRPRTGRSARALGRHRRPRWAAAFPGPVGDVARAEPSRHPGTARRAAPRGRFRDRALERPHRDRREQPCGTFLAGDQPPLGLHVFVPDFPAKAANLVRNLAENRARLIQAVLTAAE